MKEAKLKHLHTLVCLNHLISILLIMTWGLRHSLKKMKHQKMVVVVVVGGGGGGGGVWFWNKRHRHLCTHVLKVEENFMQRLPTFLLFLLSQKIGLKALLTCDFIPSLLTLESRKKYTVTLFLTSTVGGERLFLFSWETLEGG